MKVETIDVFHFMGVTHLVTEHEGVQYLALKPIVDQIGMDWRTQKRLVLSEEGVVLYGAVRVDAKEMQAQGGISPPKDGVYIPYKSVSMYLARISVARVKSNGNVEACAVILKLQKEWLQALHDYETKGIAVKADHIRERDSRRKEFLAFATLIKTKSSTTNLGERRALSAGIKEMASDLDIPVEGDLFDDVKTA